MVSSTLRFGVGATAEVGMDMKNMQRKLVFVITDRQVRHLPPIAAVEQSLKKNGIEYKIWDGVDVEPTDVTFQNAIDAIRKNSFDSVIAVGGGSSLDTGKVAAIFASNKTENLWDFVTPPFGKGLNPKKPIVPLVCIPTTAGTGSEMTSVAICDLHDRGVKTGIRNRALKPTLAIVDPLHIKELPRHVAIYSGFDVLCHALESFTAIPFTERARPADPSLRPVYQGSNPISDVWSKHALAIMRQYFFRSVNDQSDIEAKTQMMLAASYAGMGFGNAGVHLCHGLSYPISGQVKKYTSPDYSDKVPLIPHGLSVCLTAPAVFQFTSPACPDRHLTAADLLGSTKAKTGKNDDAGKILGEKIQQIMSDFKVPNGLSSVGFEKSDIGSLAKESVNSLSAIALQPRLDIDKSDETLIPIFSDIYEKSLRSY